MLLTNINFTRQYEDKGHMMADDYFNPLMSRVATIFEKIIILFLFFGSKDYFMGIFSKNDDKKILQKLFPDIWHPKFQGP